jgi:putative MFS transporter
MSAGVVRCAAVSEELMAPILPQRRTFAPDVGPIRGVAAVIFLGYPFGSAVSVPLMERFERKHLIVASAAAMAVLGVVFGFAGAPWLIIAAGFLLTSCSNVFSNGFHIYQAEIFPTRMRSTAVSTSYSLSRLSGAILPFISVAALDHLGPTAVFLGSAAILVIVCLDVGLLGPRSTGMNLEDSSDEVAATAERRVDDGPRFRREGTPAVAHAGRDDEALSGRER